MNADHVEAIVLLAKLHAGIDTIEAAMTSVDRLASLFG
jgi:putative heme iron utilization protein